MTMNLRTRVNTVLSLAVLLGVLALPSVAFAISKSEVITLAKLGIGEDEIIQAIDKDRTIFNLNINEILELKNAGVPEKVIRHMLATPQMYGAVQAPAVPVVAAPMPGVQQAVVEKTPKEIRAEAERAKAEALRLKQEQERAMDAQKQAYAKGQLKTGMDLAEKGEYVEAIRLFQNFIQKNNYGPTTDEYYNARYGMALALVKAGLYESAASMLLEIVLQGPDKTFFQAAFHNLVEMRKRVAYSPPDLEQLTQFFVGNFSRGFQDKYNYFLGEFFYEGSNYSMALKYFGEVSTDSQLHAKARYLTGLVQVANQMYKSAVQSFQEAVESQNRNKSEARVADMAYLALARIAYETGNYDGAILYYRKIPKNSPRLPDAFYEMGWTYFMKGDYSRAVGTFHALHSPFFDHYFYPELWILESTIYMNMCQYDRARLTLEMFKRHVSTKAIPLDQFIRNMRTQAEYYMAFVRIGNGQGGAYNLPMELMYPVMANADIYRLYKTIAQVEKELKALTGVRGKLGSWGEETISMLENQKISRINEIGIKIQMAFRNIQKDLRDYQVKVTEIELDLNQVEMEKIEQSTKELLAEQQLTDAVNGLVRMKEGGRGEADLIKFVGSDPIFRLFKDKHFNALRKAQIPARVVEAIEDVVAGEENVGGSTTIVGSDSLEWPFEGDYWEDEIWGYRSFVKEECK
jgi:TolA-binding protein